MVSALKRKPTQSYFCNWRWARMGIVKWDYYLWNEQWKLILVLTIIWCISLQLSIEMTISIQTIQTPQYMSFISASFFNGLKADVCQSVLSYLFDQCHRFPESQNSLFSVYVWMIGGLGGAITLSAQWNRILLNRGWGWRGKASWQSTFHISTEWGSLSN